MWASVNRTARHWFGWQYSCWTFLVLSHEDVSGANYKTAHSKRCLPLPHYPTNSDGKNAFIVAASFTALATGNSVLLSK